MAIKIAPKTTAPTPDPVRARDAQTGDTIGQTDPTKPNRKGVGGRPRADDPKVAVSLRLPRSVLDRWQQDPEWRAKMAAELDRLAP